MKLSIDRSFLDQVDLVSLIEQRTPTRFGKPSGNGTKRTVKGACPWCGGEDRFAVFCNETPQRFYCGVHGHSGCNHKHGDAITFLREYESLSFREAVAILTGEEIPQASHATYNTASSDAWKGREWQEKASHFCTDAEHCLWAEGEIGERVLAYLVGRGLTEKTIRSARLGAALYDSALCLVIPWFDSKQEMYWRVELRAISPDAENRYKNYPGSSVRDGMYGTDSLLFNRPAVFLVEGALDVLSIAQEASDLVSVVSTGSTGGSHNPRWIMRLANVPHVFVAFDSEAKAEKSAAYWLQALPNATRWRTPIGKDANEMLVRGDVDIKMWVEAALATLDVTPVEAVSGSLEMASERSEEEVNISDERIGTYSIHDRVRELREQQSEQLPVIRKAARDTIPSWLEPGSHDWNKQIKHMSEPKDGTPALYTRPQALQEMLQRRQAWFDQQKRPQDVVQASGA